MAKLAKIVQLRNPRTGRYVRVNRETGSITGHKVSPGPYKGIPISRRRGLGHGKKAQGKVVSPSRTSQEGRKQAG